MVLSAGLEPATTCIPSRCSTLELRQHDGAGGRIRTTYLPGTSWGSAILSYNRRMVLTERIALPYPDYETGGLLLSDASMEPTAGVGPAWVRLEGARPRPEGSAWRGQVDSNHRVRLRRAKSYPLDDGRMAPAPGFEPGPSH